MNQPVCSRCKGKGTIRTVYNEVMDASGMFYDRDTVYELRSITIRCPACKQEKKS